MAKHVFSFSYPDVMGLDIWALNSAWSDDSHNLRSVGLLIFGAYNAFDTCRYTAANNDHDAYHCIQQHCRQGTAGHPESTKHLDSCWKSEVVYVC